MKSDAFICDVCRAQREPANHWLILLPARQDTGAKRIVALFAIFEWDDALAGDSEAKHLCGHSCATRALSAALGEKG